MPAKKVKKAANRKPGQKAKRRAAASIALQFGRGVRITPLNQRKVNQLVTACLESDMAITLRFVTDAEARSLNQQFRNSDYVPNVLTFAYPPQPEADIVICTPEVRRQAKLQGKTYEAHLAHMIVHGTLHAQGYTHDKPARAREMEKLECCLMAKFGLPNPYLSPA
jgi:probable rRNA maturation factor